MRLVWLAMLLVAALVAMFWPRDRGVGDVERLEWLATAQQLGVVGYRDPVGVVSRDGQRLAFVEGRRLFETPTSGGPRLELVAAQAQIRHVARGAVDGEWIFEDSATPARWWAVRFGTMPWPVFGDRREIADTRQGAGYTSARCDSSRYRPMANGWRAPPRERRGSNCGAWPLTDRQRRWYARRRRADLDTRRAQRVTALTRDSYAPSISADGRVMFKVQSYRTTVAEIDLSSGTVKPLSTLQAETPSYHPDGRRVAVTYGTWRRVIDDVKYSDIAQDIGVIPAGAGVTPTDRCSFSESIRRAARSPRPGAK